MKIKLMSLVAMFAFIAMQGCYPDGPDYVDELDIVYTNYDASFDFGSVNTYSLPDEVVEVNSSDFSSRNGSDTPEFVDEEYSTLILDVIRENMTNLGWTEVDKEDSPDMIILPSVSKTTYLYYYYDWYYWNWWYPGGYVGRGWYYPGYYLPAYRSGFRSGILFIQMTDAKNSSVDNGVPVPWSVVINGLLQGSPSYFSSRLHKAIDQAFEQSPYLQQEIYR
ncbi:MULTISPECIES: DUF4136 domain-containing protein [unclassified Imperialibacter]|uniref:DUF4136 domain-containing protein n=1 Tax=unclassified Imperialibacter TaxID=2629706 RepID=UPI001251A520|nr:MULTISPECIES: DUF4136 domain-containing protein [unclassified Imperialibacter]CAD5265561.1 conserved exported hypothetical protein [Imperialibacter sp. 89]CAD5270385.1 conserved exported hypothetical protein [Imperialibacter sp. 75]VVT10028.1 conserved exported hypothetical protein [Imperialibacter sp. EC-SDR9]